MPNDRSSESSRRYNANPELFGTVSISTARISGVDYRPGGVRYAPSNTVVHPTNAFVGGLPPFSATQLKPVIRAAISRTQNTELIALFLVQRDYLFRYILCSRKTRKQKQLLTRTFPTPSVSGS